MLAKANAISNGLNWYEKSSFVVMTTLTMAQAETVERHQIAMSRLVTSLTKGYGRAQVEKTILHKKKDEMFDFFGNRK